VFCSEFSSSRYLEQRNKAEARTGRASASVALSSAAVRSMMARLQKASQNWTPSCSFGSLAGAGAGATGVGPSGSAMLGPLSGWYLYRRCWVVAKDVMIRWLSVSSVLGRCERRKD
jgi:hypothetical protein